MKKITLLAFVTLISVTILSCKKSTTNPLTDTKTNTDPTVQTTTTSYINYKVNGTAISEKVISATRGTDVAYNVAVNTLLIVGTGTEGNLKFATHDFNPYTPLGVAFKPGIGFGCSSGTYPDNYLEYISSKGVLYSSRHSTINSMFSFTNLLYEKDGAMYGTFNGTLQSAQGDVVTIAEGTFNLKFSN